MLVYQLLNAAGYRFNICKAGRSVYDCLSYLYKDNFPDIEITRQGASIDTTEILNKCLITINGYVYNSEVIDNRLYVPNATLSMLKSRKNQVGMLSFDLQNNLVKIPIVPDMVVKDPPYTLYQRAIISFPQPVIKPVLILGGYLVFEDPSYFYRISDDTYVLKLELLPFMERLYETQRYRNIFSELDVQVSPNNPSALDPTEVTSDDTITKYLTLFNSFLVDLGVQSLNIDKVYLERSNIPETFRTQILPNKPLIVGYGKIAEYTYRQNVDTMYTVYTTDSYYNNHLLSYLDPNDIKIYNDHRDPRTTYYLSPAFFLSINAS